MKKSRFERRRYAEVVVAPSAERRSHGEIIRPDSRLAVIDVAGRRSAPFRALSTLDILERNNTITPGMRQAGNAFHSIFRLAQLDTLHSADMERVCGIHLTEYPGIERARRQIRRCMLLLGGPMALPASCAWYVIGWELSLNAWALQRSWNGPSVNPHGARGVLLSALCVLSGASIEVRMDRESEKTY